MKKLLLLMFCVIGFNAQSQNLPQCDSLVIQCCTWDSIGTNDTLTIFAENPSTELFGYPGFILFDMNMDTIAKENVNYFGIGTGPQPHYLDIRTPIVLPFSGKLNLYTGFYDTIACSFPIHIPDTATLIGEMNDTELHVFFPNPANDVITIRSRNAGTFLFSILDITGRLVMEDVFSETTVVDVGGLKAGVYLLRIEDLLNGSISSHRLVVSD